MYHFQIDASELTGVCSVGNSEPWTLLCFVIVPRSAVLFVGFCLIVAGFSSMCQERKAFRRRVITFFQKNWTIFAEFVGVIGRRFKSNFQVNCELVGRRKRRRSVKKYEGIFYIILYSIDTHRLHMNTKYASLSGQIFK